MATFEAAGNTRASARGVAWIPLVVLPPAAGLVGQKLPAWVAMWLLAASIYGALKWLTLQDSEARRTAPAGRSLAYLFFWPGMDATAFLNQRGRGPSVAEWAEALVKIAAGAALLYAAAPLAVERWPLLAGWLGMAGIALVLHFGLFHLLSAGWRRVGWNAPPIMQSPVRSTSLAEFWGRRWNLAFRDVAHAYVFRPLLRPIGPAGATMAVFVVSGIVHDIVITLPAGAGYGLPTLYFLLQGAGLLLERSAAGKSLGLGRGLRGWLFCAAVVLAPVGLLFPPPFIQRVVLPLLTAMGAVP